LIFLDFHFLIAKLWTLCKNISKWGHMYYIVYNVHIDVLLRSKRDTVVIETSQK
jgi:hypothetical protein